VLVLKTNRLSKGEREGAHKGNKFNDPKEYGTAARVVMRDKTHKISLKKRENAREFSSFFHVKNRQREEPLASSEELLQHAPLLPLSLLIFTRSEHETHPMESRLSMVKFAAAV
jgi:hypothetical protein